MKGCFDFPRLGRWPSSLKEPDIWWKCPICGHCFDKELNDLTIKKGQELNQTVERQAKFLYEKAGMTIKEIAEELKRPEPTIQTMKDRGKWTQ